MTAEQQLQLPARAESIGMVRDVLCAFGETPALAEQLMCESMSGGAGPEVMS